MTEIGCMAHARRKFFDLQVANKSQLAEQALHSIGGLYEVERQARDMSDEDRWRIRQEKAAPIIKTLHDWILAQRDLVRRGCAHRQQPSRKPDQAGLLGAPTGCSPDLYAAVNGRQQS